MFQIMKTLSASLVTLLAVSHVHGLVARQSGLSSGTYSITPFIDAPFVLGAISGPAVGVVNATSSTSTTFTVAETDEGYVISLPEGYAAAVDGHVELVPDYPGSFWFIAPVEGAYRIDTLNGVSSWAIPHDAPAGTQVSVEAGSATEDSLFFIQ